MLLCRRFAAAAASARSSPLPLSLAVSPAHCWAFVLLAAGGAGVRRSVSIGMPLFVGFPLVTLVYISKVHTYMTMYTYICVCVCVWAFCFHCVWQTHWLFSPCTIWNKQDKFSLDFNGCTAGKWHLRNLWEGYVNESFAASFMQLQPLKTRCDAIDESSEMQLKWKWKWN